MQNQKNEKKNVRELMSERVMMNVWRAHARDGQDERQREWREIHHGHGRENRGKKVNAVIKWTKQHLVATSESPQ